ncbi:MAG: hypothetical protein JJE09_14725 [Bacteroidia bacterium]|nr:hypothetical protein [Bacteroidia bacterium]
MTNFELIDDYLTNRLTESEKVGFEQQVASDPTLNADVEFQRNILRGIEQARAADLKAMLKNVPIGAPVSISMTAMKIAAGIIGAGLLIGSLYYYYQPEGLQEVPNLSTSIQDSVQGNDSVESTEKIMPVEEPVEENDEPVVPEAKEEKSVKAKKEINKPSSVTQPKIEVVDPTDEMSSEDNRSDVVLSENSKSAVSVSNIQVDTDSSNKKYNFHYQFNSDKLQLFGPFDKSLYEILEINGDSKAVFLFYRENYYLLDEKQIKITKLSMIKDSELIKKLKEYRGR